MVEKYPVITLCGSTRFKDEFMQVQKQLTLQGKIVISVGLFGHSGDEEVWENMDEGTLTKTKEMLDDMHKRKIDMADGIYVINKGGYIGDSTRSEIEYALQHGKSVEYLEAIESEKKDDILVQKQFRLDMLTKSRRKCNACAYVQNKTDVVLYNSATDPNTDVPTIGQWTMWNGNLNAEYMIVGQDWGTKKYFLDFKAQKKLTGDIPCELDNTTNKNLATCIMELNSEWDILKMDGIERNDRYPLYFTNEILCYKDEQYMNASIPAACYRECSGIFLLEQINIVEPNVVVLLGSDAFKNFIRAAKDSGLTCGLTTTEKFEDIITSVLAGKEKITYRTKSGKTVKIIPMWHPGGFGARNAKVAYTEKGGDKDTPAIDILKEQWKKLKVLVEENYED